jgi:3D (Asp-Asp-Asp) domain-containing protein
VASPVLVATAADLPTGGKPRAGSKAIASTPLQALELIPGQPGACCISVTAGSKQTATLRPSHVVSSVLNPRVMGKDPVLSRHFDRYRYALLLPVLALGLMACDPAPSGGAGSGEGPVVGAVDPNVVPANVISVGSFKVLCYTIKGRTATGVQTSTEVVAVDPKVIPLKSRIFIKGVGWRTALDTGGSIKGNVLDIWLPTLADCRAFGVKTLSVYKPA